MGDSSVKIKVGVSSCLLGEKVRWNGDHKRDRAISDTLARYFEFVPVCPEVEAGMGVPREPARLVRGSRTNKLTGGQSGKNWTGEMRRFNTQKITELARCEISGFIFKSKSPSCGTRGVPLYLEEGGKVSGYGPGIFAKALMERLPLVPVEQEDRLQDPSIRENFLVRVCALHRFQCLLKEGFSKGALVKFHERHKLLLLSHSRKHLVALGQRVARSGKVKAGYLESQYGKLFMAALSLKSTPAKNTDALLHALGHLKHVLSQEEKRKFLEAIKDYRGKKVPLATFLAMLRDHAEKHQADYLLSQVYLIPSLS